MRWLIALALVIATSGLKQAPLAEAGVFKARGSKDSKPAATPPAKKPAPEKAAPADKPAPEKTVAKKATPTAPKATPAAKKEKPEKVADTETEPTPSKKGKPAVASKVDPKKKKPELVISEDAEEDVIIRDIDD